MFAVIGILMALRAREQTGEGQFIDVSMQDCMISTMTSNYMTYLGSGVAPKPLGTCFATVAPYRVFQAKDRGFSLAVGSEKLWSAFCKVLGRAELETHPDYATNAARCTNRAALDGLLGAIFGERTADEWIGELRSVGIPCTPVRDFAEVVSHPQSEARGMFPCVEHAAAGMHRVTGTPIKMSETPGHPGAGAPAAGQHTLGALQDLVGLGPEALRELRECGAIFSPDSL
jgi:crotonobetainyl-CoA:carnitine CoA-transferase CaiB-like acyl-CoA transferase